MADIQTKVLDAETIHVTINNNRSTTHKVSVPAAQLKRFGRPGESAESLVRRSFEFLLEREPNTSILSRFDLATIQSYFSEYEKTIKA